MKQVNSASTHDWNYESRSDDCTVEDAIFGDKEIDALIMTAADENHDYYIDFINEETCYSMDDLVNDYQANELCEEFIKYLKVNLK